MLRASKTILIALAVTVAVAGMAQAGEMKIEEGYNFLTTSPGSYTTISLPEGFFGEKDGVPSDAIVNRRIPLEGRPFGNLGLGPASNLVVSTGDCHSRGGHHHCHEATEEQIPGQPDVDTITRVSGTTISETHGTGTVTLQMVAVSLQTPAKQPLEVSYGKAGTESFRVVLTQDNSVEQRVGSITLNRNKENGGGMQVELPVAFKVLFTNKSQRFGPVALNTALLSDDNGFTVETTGK